MLSQYERPKIFFESFEMDQAIAACWFDMNNSTTVENCTATIHPDDGGDETVYFAASNNSCQARQDEYCYTSSTDSDNVFNS